MWTLPISSYLAASVLGRYQRDRWHKHERGECMKTKREEEGVTIAEGVAERAAGKGRATPGDEPELLHDVPLGAMPLAHMVVERCAKRAGNRVHEGAARLQTLITALKMARGSNWR